MRFVLNNSDKQFSTLKFRKEGVMSLVSFLTLVGMVLAIIFGDKLTKEQSSYFLIIIFSAFLFFIIGFGISFGIEKIFPIGTRFEKEKVVEIAVENLEIREEKGLENIRIEIYKEKFNKRWYNWLVFPPDNARYEILVPDKKTLIGFIARTDSGKGGKGG